MQSFLVNISIVIILSICIRCSPLASYWFPDHESGVVTGGVVYEGLRTRVVQTVIQYQVCYLL